MSDISLAEYLAQAYRGQNIFSMNHGSPLGSDFLQKQTYLTVS